MTAVIDPTATTESLEARVLHIAFRSEQLAEWADIIGYEAGQVLRIARHDTDRAELTVRAKDIRRALRRSADEATAITELGLAPDEWLEVARLHRGGPVTPATADHLIQIAAIGRVVY